MYFFIGDQDRPDYIVTIKDALISVLKKTEEEHNYEIVFADDIVSFMDPLDCLTPSPAILPDLE